MPSAARLATGGIVNGERWLENDRSGRGTGTVAEAFTGLEGIELVRFHRVVSASGAADDWRPAMRKGALAVLETWNADLAVVGSVTWSRRVKRCSAWGARTACRHTQLPLGAPGCPRRIIRAQAPKTVARGHVGTCPAGSSPGTAVCCLASGGPNGKPNHDLAERA